MTTKNIRMFLSANDLKKILFIFLAAALFFSIPACHQKSGGKKEEAPGKDAKDMALLYLSQNHIDEAAAAFQQAIQEAPDDITNYESLMRLYLLKKDYGAAEKTAQGALKVKPDNQDIKLLLADAYIGQGNESSAEDQLKKILDENPKNVNAYYKLSELNSSGANDSALKKYYLLKVVELAPANIVPRMQLTEIFAGQNKTDSSRYYLQSIKKIAPDFSAAAAIAYDKAIALLAGNKGAAALPAIRQFHDLMKIAPEYATGKDSIEIPPMHAGYFDFQTNVPVSVFDSGQQSGTGRSNLLKTPLHFTSFTGNIGFAIDNGAKAAATVFAHTDYDAQGNIYLYSSYFIAGATSSKAHLVVDVMGSYKECKVNGAIDHDGEDLSAAFADYDNDGYADLFIATTKGIIVFKNQGDGSFSKVKDNMGLDNANSVNSMLFADFDQDGDLDLFAGQKTGNKLFRNNGDGTFTEQAATMGLASNGAGTTDADFGDYDNDGDIDILGLNANGQIQLFGNQRHAHFTDVTGEAGLQNPKYTGTAVAFGDYNNDGNPDIFIAGASDGSCSLLENENGHYEIDESASKKLTDGLKGIKVNDIAFIDYDNDGYQDIVVAGINSDASKSGIKLFHNDSTKGFSDASALLPADITQAYHLGTTDFNFDGDEDIYFSGPDGLQLARNDGGNNNNYVQVQLTGLSYGNTKNNRLGIGARLELKAGNLYQAKTVKSPLTEFGVGAGTKLDALRIIWPNGTPQTIVDPTIIQKTLEEEQLKGSCPFLFTWNGKKYEFLKDMLWRSAMGMPLAIHGKDTTYAFSGPSKEYLLIPGEKLQPRDGMYSLKITEELWEAVYFDKVALVAVDHPDSVNTFADERFVAPPYPGRKVYTVSGEHLPVSATDGDGNDLMSKISNYDFQYVSNFSIGKFQGVAKEHDLILDLGDKAKSDNIHLFMRGWIFPTDASINTELTQTTKYRQQFPSLQVINSKGKWQTVIPNIGFPMGRDKMMVIDLSGKFLTPNDRRVRIRTNMQIYWDHIFFSTGNANAPVKMYDIKMTRAQLDYHGYSASYHKGGPYGPQWFDYDQVTTGQKWRDLTGYYTRYGDVTPLLRKADDEYIIADGGDEVTINFDAAHLPALPKGWKRDFLIYSEGWVKDGDLNTAYGQTVAPLPFHNMPSYPYGKDIFYPYALHKAYMQQYNTRKVTDDDFKNALKLQSITDKK
ncbi:MAG TPA: FG-GAP-like repeat-containing protein [Chitinophagaceae bacterium]|nr:FG-GAP-like repeat-containing protein [Chitinophagaceae bacterium]